MSKFIVALTLPEFGSTPNSPTSGFYKYYLRNNWLKVLNSSGVQKDVVLDRPLDGFVADNPPCLPITATDTVLTAFEKFQCIMNNLAIITGSLKAATPWTAEHTLANNDQYQAGTIVYYMNSVYKCILANDGIVPTNTTYWQYLGVASGFYTQEQADWNAITGSSFIRNKPTIPPTPIQPDWNQTNTSSLDFIKNKPTNFGFDPVACNDHIVTKDLNSCGSAPLDIQNTYAAQVRLHGQNIGKGPGLIVTNTVHGYLALGSNISGAQNTAIGYQSLLNCTTGSYNTSLGKDSLKSLTTGERNVAIGGATMLNLTTGSNNTAINQSMTNSIITGQHNIGIGYNSFQALTSGNYNVGIGDETLYSITTGLQNVAISHAALKNTTIGNNNIAIGSSALMANTTGIRNISIGINSGYSRTEGDGNIMIGVDSGYGALGSTTNSSNIGVGDSALYSITSGRENTVVGTNAAAALTTAYYNVAIGSEAMQVSGRPGSITGDHNIGIGGKQVLAHITSGIANIAIGTYALKAITTESNNVAIGISAGESCTGSNNVFIGPNAGAWQTNVSNKIIIDTKSRGSAANEDVLAPIVAQAATAAEDQTVTLNAVLKLKPLTGPPSSPTKGMIYCNDGDSKLYYYNGSSWIDLTA